MLNFIRTHKRLMLFFTVLMILPSFVFFGVQGFYSLSSGNEVAKIGSMPLTINQYENFYKNWANQQSRENPDLDMDVLQSDAARQIALRQLVSKAMVSVATQDARLVVTDESLGLYLAADPVIKSILNEEGKPDPKLYLQLAQQNRFATPQDFEEQRRVDIGQGRLIQAVSSNVLSKTDVDMLATRLGQKYTIRQKMFVGMDYVDEVKLSDEDVKAYYEQHKNEFMAPATVDVEYVVLNSEEYIKNLAVSDEAVREFYEQNKEVLPVLQKRRASHILIEVPMDATQEQQKQAFAKAKGLLDELKKDGSKFAELAKANSADEATAANGGDVGVFTAGEMTEAFEQAAFSMNAPGLYEEIVPTDDGFHILMVTEAVVRPFEDLDDKAKQEIVQKIRTQKADAELLQISEDLREGVHTSPDSFTAIAEKLKLNVEQAKGVTLEPQPGADGLLANPVFLGAIFAPQAIESKLNIQPVAVSPTEYVSARVLNFKEAHVRPFDEVKDDAAKRALRAKELELAAADAQKSVDEWKKDPSAAKDLEALQISQIDYFATKTDIAQGVFEQITPASQLPQVLSIKVGSEGYAVVLVEKIEDDASQNNDLAAYVENIVSKKGSEAEQEAFMQYLYKKHKVQVYPNRIPTSSN